MAFQFFAVPLVIASPGGGRAACRVPKYVNGSNLDWALCDLGLNPYCLVGIDPDAALLATLNGAADVHAFPINLDLNPTAGQLTAMQTKLEAAAVPANDFTTLNTFRDVCRRIFQVARFYQRHHALANSALLNGGVTLDTPFSSLAANVKTKLVATAVDLNLNTASLSGASTVRQILIALANQFPNDCAILGVGI